MTHKEKSKCINIVGIIIMLILLYFGVFEASNADKQINTWKPDVVYKMTNQSISWD